jgi:hypothetical protein
MNDKIIHAIQKRVASEPYAKKLGIRLIKVELGYALVEMDVVDDMANIHNITHGGAIFSLIDEAFEISKGVKGRIKGNTSFQKDGNLRYQGYRRRGTSYRIMSGHGIPKKGKTSLSLIRR